MPEEASGQRFSGEPKVQPATDLPGASIGSQNPPTTPADDDGPNDKDESAELKKIARGERWLIGTGIASVLVTAGLGYIYNLQLGQMRKSTHAAEVAAYASCVASQISSEALIQSIQSGRDAHDASVASTYQTIVATKAEAAYVYPFLGDFDLVIGQTTYLNWGYKNEGKSAAISINASARAIFVKRGEDPPIEYPKALTLFVKTPRLDAGEIPSSLKSNPKLIVSKNGQPWVPTEADYEDLSSGRRGVLIFVRLTYIDSIGVHHWVNFCRTMPPIYVATDKEPAHLKCINYNKEDTNTAISLVRKLPVAEPASIPKIICPTPPQSEK
jgi:hypothetical protein